VTIPSGWTLAIDTATGINVGLAHGGQPVAARSEESSRKHVELLQPMVDALLADAGVVLGDLDRIVVGVGPGPFTGLRIGIVTARTLGFVTGVPVRGACTLDAIALRWFAGGDFAPPPPGSDVVVATDARRHELYWARYAPSGERLGAPEVSAPADLPNLPTAGPGVGAAPTLDAALLAARIDDLPDVGLEPLYLRKPDAELPRTRKSALAGGRLLALPTPPTLPR